MQKEHHVRNVPGIANSNLTRQLPGHCSIVKHLLFKHLIKSSGKCTLVAIIVLCNTVA